MSDKITVELGSHLQGQLLIAMPDMSDPRFQRSVVQICAHSDDGAMGLIINKRLDELDLGQLLEQIDLSETSVGSPLNEAIAKWPVYTGGPVENHRGFVLHSPDYYSNESTLDVSEAICLTATPDVLAAMAAGEGPHNALVALGYAGWSPGQLEAELGANAWLNCPSDASIVFADEGADKYALALSQLGVDPSHLVSSAGRA
jgi:putative transcriptional regulator